MRITTRVDEADPRECIYSTIHEVGHAVYEQGLDPALALLPAGAHASMGVHESQSRLFENQIGRSRAFCALALAGAARRRSATSASDGPEALYRAVNAVETGFIRTEADEVHYNLHVMMRFDLERALIAGDLAVARPRGGVERPLRRRLRPRGARRPARACCRTCTGRSGSSATSRPTRSATSTPPSSTRRCAATCPTSTRGWRRATSRRSLAWLRARIHRRGRLLAPRALIAEACGREPDAATLLGQLEAKYGELYTL